MKKNLWRLVVALIISSGGYIGTGIWFGSGKGDDRHGDAKPIARLNNSNNEVQRKPQQRVIWETVSRNDDLYPGEAVRTGPTADAQLYFMKSHTTVHLDPDSLVVLEENDKGLSLDFLQGNMFVQSTSGDTPGEGLTLKTGNGEIKLKSADMSLSRNQNGNVDLEVHRGEAELSQGSKKTALNKERSAELSDKGVAVAEERIQILHPQAGDSVYLNLTRGEKLALNWKPLPPGYSMNVEVGKMRNLLTKVPDLTSAGATGALNLTAKPGRWYLRLVATSADAKQPQLASAVIPVIVEAKSPPSLLEPRQEASILKPAPDSQVNFHWVNRYQFHSQVFEVAKDPQFKITKLHEQLEGEATSFAKDLADGAYYWRVTGYLNEKDGGLSSPANQFTVISKWEVKPPVQLAPAVGQHLSFLETQKSGVTLKWQPVQGVDRFKLNVAQKTPGGWSGVHEQETETPSARLTDLKPGTYHWSVASLDSHGGTPKSSPAAEFTIEEMPKIDWVEAKPTVEYEYSTPTPSLRGHWKPIVPAPATYRYKVAALDQELDGADWQQTKQTLFDIPLAADGAYTAQVEALNAKGQLLGQSEVKNFVIKRQPLLPAPQWAKSTPDVLKSDAKGNLTLGWSEVEGAKNYLMILESSDGKVLDQKEVSRNTASLNRLKPGEYQVHLKSVDGFKRPGLDGEKRKVEVPATSDIRAPKFKTMKVK